MRHGDKINNLSRTASHRKALLSGLACQLIEHKKIVTTVAKAKALRVYVEPLITKSKENTTHQRRIVFRNLNDKRAVTELFATVSPKIAGRPGGYTRIIKLGKRVGDSAELALIELVDFNEIYGKGVAEAATTRRTRRGRSRKAATKPETEAAKATEVPETAEEESKTADVPEATAAPADSEENKTEEAAPEADAAKE